MAVAEGARNVVCVGAKPIAITNCLNFASPERPEVMQSFSDVIDGIKEACEMFETPVVSGNVSFYNETDGRGILPTPVIGMVGLIEDTRKIITQGFKNEGDIIALLGVTNDDLSVSEYAQAVLGQEPPIEPMKDFSVMSRPATSRSRPVVGTPTSTAVPPRPTPKRPGRAAARICPIVERCPMQSKA